MRGISKKILGITVVACLSAVLATSLAGCAGGGNGGASGSGGNSIAATVNGQKIMEADITAQVEAFRVQSQLESEGSWVQWLKDNGFTPADIREVKIQENVEGILLDNVCLERGITISDDDVNARVNEIKDIYNNGGSSFDQMLAASGMTEKTYAQQIKEDLQKSALAESVTQNMNPTEDTLLNMANQDMKNHDGMKKYTVIYAASEDDINAAAKELAGGASFESVQSKYNENGNTYDGWGSIDAYSDSVMDASSKLAVNEVSAPIEVSANQYFIIRYTEVLNVPDNGYASFDAIPADFRDEVRANASTSLAYTEVYALLEDARQNADIVINDMPSGLSYDVDPALLVDESVPAEEPTTNEASASAASANANQATNENVAASSANAASPNENANANEQANANDNANSGSAAAEPANSNANAESGESANANNVSNAG